MAAKITCLLVDDDPDEVFIIAGIFSELMMPNRFHHVNSGEKALEYLEEAYLKINLPAAVLLDINMPGMNGVETLKRIVKNRNFANVKIYMHSTGMDPEVMATCKKLGVAGFIEKSPTNTEVRKLVEELVGSVPSWG